MDIYSKVKTAIGDFWLACSRNGITMIHPAGISEAAFEELYRRHLGIKPRRGKVPVDYLRALCNAAMGREFADVPVDLSRLTTFQHKVLDNLRRIPRGKVRTYAWLARKSGYPKAFRAVGNVMARNPVPILLPCHRVVPTTGGIGNYGLGRTLKRNLLMREGVPVDEL